MDFEQLIRVMKFSLSHTDVIVEKTDDYGIVQVGGKYLKFEFDDSSYGESDYLGVVEVVPTIKTLTVYKPV